MRPFYRAPIKPATLYIKCLEVTVILADDRNSFDIPVSFTPDNSSSKVECQVVAGIHEFQVTVTDTYGEETLEVVTIVIGNEENVAPNGRVRVVKRVTGCMDE